MVYTTYKYQILQHLTTIVHDISGTKSILWIPFTHPSPISRISQSARWWRLRSGFQQLQATLHICHVLIGLLRRWPTIPSPLIFFGEKIGIHMDIYIYICGSIEFFRLRMGSSTEIYPRNMMKHVESVESWSVVTCGTLEVAELFPSFQQPLKRLVDPIPGRSSTNLLRLPETSASLSWVVASSVPDFWSELPVGEFTEKHMSYHDPGCHGVWCAKIITIRAPCIQYCKKHMANLTNNSATKSLWADSATNKHTHNLASYRIFLLYYHLIYLFICVYIT